MPSSNRATRACGRAAIIASTDAPAGPAALPEQRAQPTLAVASSRVVAALLELLAVRADRQRTDEPMDR